KGNNMKVAKILIGSPENKKGFFNNVMERTKHLMEVMPDVDCYMIRLEYGLILRLLKGKLRSSRKEEFTFVDGLKFKNIWINLRFTDYFFTKRMHKDVVLGKRQLTSSVKLFEHYDLLSPHGIEAIYLAGLVKNKFGTPMVATWHGSEINVYAF